MPKCEDRLIIDDRATVGHNGSVYFPIRDTLAGYNDGKIFEKKNCSQMFVFQEEVNI